MVFNLEMKVNQTQVGLYTVTFGYKRAPLDIQEAAFAAKGLEIVSPAQLGFLRAKEGNGTFNSYSRTSADVFYDDRNGEVVVVPNGAVSKLVGIAHVVDAHRQSKEYCIPENQRTRVYALVDTLLENGTAVRTKRGRTDVETSRFDETELTSRLFSDESLGIKAQEYGDFLRNQGRTIQLLFFGDNHYSNSQKGPYLNRLRVYGPGHVFYVNGNNGDLDLSNGAFGVLFEKAAEGGAKK